LRNAGEKTAKVTKATKKAIQESNGLLGSFGLSAPAFFFLVLDIRFIRDVIPGASAKNLANAPDKCHR
jgi:hypothetical protein